MWWLWRVSVFMLAWWSPNGAKKRYWYGLTVQENVEMKISNWVPFFSGTMIQINTLNIIIKKKCITGIYNLSYVSLPMWSSHSTKHSLNRSKRNANITKLNNNFIRNFKKVLLPLTTKSHTSLLLMTVFNQLMNPCFFIRNSWLISFNSTLVVAQDNRTFKQTAGMNTILQGLKDYDRLWCSGQIYVERRMPRDHSDVIWK